MSLSGNLGFVPIDEILRLLTRAKQQGSVDVSGNGFYGRIFVGKGGIDLATTATDDELATQLVNSGVADDDMLRRVGTGETTLAAVAESNQEVIELIREITVESLYQISDQGKDFSVREGFTTPYASPKAFELEALLHDARTRERDWAKVSEAISDLDQRLAMNRNVGGDEVSMKADDWRVLSQIGGGASVSEIAWNLGTTSFWTARVAARLVSNGLVKLEEPMVTSTLDPEPSYEPVHYETPGYQEPSEPVQVEDDVAETVYGVTGADTDSSDDQEFSFSVATSDETTEEVLSESDESSIGFAYGAESVEDAEAPEVTSEDLETPEVSSEDHDVDANKSWWEEPTDEAEEVTAVEDDDAEDDTEEEGTEAFLEKVFSELDSGDDGAEPSEGHGLLRRRRMGTLRDFSSDS